MKTCHVILFLVLFATSLQRGLAYGGSDTFRIHTDFPANNKDEKMFLDVFYSSDSVFAGSFQVQFFKFLSENDSLPVLNKKNPKAVFKKGTNKLRLDFSKTDDSNTYYNTNFYEILKRTDNIPPGSYKVFLTVKKGEKTYQTLYLREVDSLLSPNSPVRQDINKSLVPKQKSFLGMRLEKTVSNEAKASGADKTLAHAKNKVDKAAKKRGLTSVHSENNGKSYIDLFYHDWFAGRYEVKSKEPLSKQIDQQNKLANPPNLNSATSNDLGHPSLFSQYKKLNNEKKDNDEIKGEIGLTTNLSSGQEQYSGVDNNYYELRGRIEMPVSGIPVEMEGLYTSQDEHNQIKASYFKVHYDVEKMKDNLNKSVSSYNSKFAQTQSKGVGMQQIYQASISNLEGQKAKLQNEITAEANAKKSGAPSANNGMEKNLENDLKKQAKDTSGLKQAVAGNKTDSTDAADSSSKPQQAGEKTGDISGKEANAKNKINEDTTKLAAKRKRIEELNKKIETYKILLAQDQNTNHFDSLVGYDKTKDFSNQSDLTYKQMAKKSTAMLPDGQAKGFLAGVTNMDAGMFPKEESKYTMSGQMMKGIDFGYDLGFCQAGVTLGKTQYVGADGSLDKYTCYSEKTTFKPAKNQKISLIYYGYTPDRTFYAGDAFFKNMNISAPGFLQPVHIISLDYSGAISKYVTIGGEAATSIKQTDNSVTPTPSATDKMAYDFNVAGNIPGTKIRLEGSYDKTGKDFQNNTLPISLSGTEQYKLAGKNDFFRSLLTVGIEYDYLVQSNFSSQSSSAKWGFDVKTNFKKYPNAAVSYKPFTTFRSYTDTLAIPQRPLLGSVWTGRMSWQIKMHQRSIRFLALYNRSTTSMDTAKYGTTLMQFSTVYTDKILTSSVTIGYSQITGSSVGVIPTAPNDMAFLSLSGSYMLSKKLSITGGQDFGMASFGFCKYGLNGGFMYRPDKAPVTLRFNLRFTTYELNAGGSWQQLYGGNVDLLYKFKMKNNKKNF